MEKVKTPNKVILSTSHVDMHGDSMKDVLEKTQNAINGSSKSRMLINHKRNLPPIGYWDNAELIYKNDHCYLIAEENLYGNREIVDWDGTLVKEVNDKACGLLNRNVACEGLEISVDKNNFKSFEECKIFKQELKSIWGDDIHTEIHSRKAGFPDPEVLIKIAPTVIVYHLLHPLIKRIGEKIADDIADSIYSKSKEKIKLFQKYVLLTIRKARKSSIPKNKPIVTIFEIPGEPYIELFAKTDDAALVSKSLSENKFKPIKEEIERLSKFVTISEIHFCLNERGNWKFAYLITPNGEIIGTKTTFKERDKVYNRVLLSPTAGYSIAGGGLQFEEEEVPDLKQKGDE